MDKVVFIDLHNQIWRACVSFAGSTDHILCSPCDNDYHDGGVHCACNSPWNIEESYCYGDKFGYVFNFFRNLRPLVEMFQPDKLYAVGEGRPQFRYDLFPDYKANRIVKTASTKGQAADDKFHQAKDIIISLMAYLPITVARAANYEADDTIGTLCDNMKEEDLTVITGDADYTQLLQRGYSNVRVYHPIKKVFLETPSYPFIAFRCLAGDKSDGIPNLLGPKTALKTIQDAGLFEQFMSIQENFSNFQRNRQLIEFAKVPETEIWMQEGIRNYPALKAEFERMKFASITNDKAWAKYTSTFDCIKY
jgi:5'-3' exonuclease